MAEDLKKQNDRLGNIDNGEAFTFTGAHTMSGNMTLSGDNTLSGTNTFTTAPKTSVGVGAKNGSTVVATEYGTGIVHKTLLTCTATTITITDDAGTAQYGGVKVYDFPEGMICTLGAVIDGSLTAGVTGTIIDAFDGDVALGTATATTGATLTGTEADILQSVALTQGVTKVANCDAQSVATALTESGARWHDGTATAKDAYLNFVIDDDATHTAGTATFTGTITLLWLSLGDN
jgi:hypothetical protein